MFGLSESVISELNNIFRKYPAIDEVVIFGSRAKGNFTNGSDIDLAVKGGITSDDILKINLDLEDVELLYKVDVISYNEKIGTPIGRHIDRVSKVFYKK
ncbi:nucleotidyltransferase domain-containing protein [uncultured Bacteroides sp.]|uniref:nucleotidyltransferase domain-containing protein n=1 Tax=uncultured Bacteroides sp. TaxID=162156 RepID=UPI002AA8EAB4|nr:nucleotidyltransferase domain-containing protein [uncultured Bacteroides sp.]